MCCFHPIRLPAAVGVAILTVSACSSGQPVAQPVNPGGGQAASESPAIAESTTPAPEVTNARLGITYDGGVMIVEEDSMQHMADLPAQGFLRLNAAGDDRHLLLSTTEGFQVLDTGVAVRDHGDHVHLYGHEPALTDIVYPAPEPGHAVVNADRLALFSDGAGTAQILAADDVTEGPEAAQVLRSEPHHGVAVPLEDGGAIMSLPDRTGVDVLDGQGAVRASSTECPGLHGEAVAPEAVTFGCTDGAIIYKGDAIIKVQSPDAYGRLGNQAGSPVSDVVLADYKVDESAELERPTRVALVDTQANDLRLVDLPASYSFRSLGRGPNGEALVLTTDGNLTVIDPEAGAISEAIEVTEPWEEPEAWQQPRPALRVAGNIAYVTEPASSELHAVHLPTSKVVDTVTLPHVPNEIQDVGLTADSHGHHHD